MAIGFPPDSFYWKAVWVTVIEREGLAKLREEGRKAVGMFMLNVVE